MGLDLGLWSFRWASTIRIVATVFLFGLLAGQYSRAQAASGASVETRVAAVNRILSDYRDDAMKREPEAASLAGDKRYDDQLSDFSAFAVNARLSRGQMYIQRLSEIDTAGLPEKTRVASNDLLNSLIDEQAGERAKAWQRPLEQFMRFDMQLLTIAEKLPFENAKDYDDYVSRLKKIPNALSQIMTNIQLGAEAGHALPQESVEKVMAQVQAVMAQPAETSPFMASLKRFPTAVEAGDRKRLTTDVLDAISTEVLPSYQRFGRFVAAHSGQKPAALAPTNPVSWL